MSNSNSGLDDKSTSSSSSSSTDDKGGSSSSGSTDDKGGSSSSSDDSSSSSHHSSLDDGYRFTLTNGVVTSVLKLDTSSASSTPVVESIKSNETWTILNNQLIKTEVEKGVTKVSVYEDANNDGLYFETSETHRGSSSQIDTKVLATSRSSVDLSQLDDSYERVRCDDGNLALDINGNAGQAYRLYKAAFDRVPDEQGLGFWIKQQDDGASLSAVAQGFMSSPEFLQRYGSNQGDDAFVQALYQNILDRAPDQSGLDFWVKELQSGAEDKAQVLVSFSESHENQVAVVGQIQNGISYQEFVG